MRIGRGLLIGIGVFWALSILFQFDWRGGTFHGTVVDEETNQPLEGAVVVVLWYKKPWLSMDGPQYFHKGTEVLTNAQGKFFIDASSGTNLNPFRFVVENPEIIIFKPGYGPNTGAYPRGVKTEQLRKGAIVRLPKLKTKEELTWFSRLGAFGVGDDTPRTSIPNLLRAINTHRQQLGIQPYSGF